MNTFKQYLLAEASEREIYDKIVKGSKLDPRYKTNSDQEMFEDLTTGFVKFYNRLRGKEQFTYSEGWDAWEKDNPNFLNFGLVSGWFVDAELIEPTEPTESPAYAEAFRFLVDIDEMDIFSTLL